MKVRNGEQFDTQIVCANPKEAMVDLGADYITC